MPRYDIIIQDRAEIVFKVMAKRVSATDWERIHQAFDLAREAHASQRRKSGEPYILHPVAVALIAAKDLRLDANSVIACFLHDVVEDTPYTIEDIRERFGDDVAFLVGAVTKRPGKDYVLSKQLDNFRQILEAVRHDIRPALVKLADRLHNMRTLASMKPEKQMKIAGETDYFYAPLANRLGLYNIKTELENLSFRYRCPEVYDELEKQIDRHLRENRANLEGFRQEISDILYRNGIKARVLVDYRRPFSVWRKMKKYGDDFNHLKYRHFLEIVFDETQSSLTEKEMAMKIYSLLTDRFKEKHASLSNYIDAPKENGYQALHVKLLADFGRWQEVHISSEAMRRQSQYGCVSLRNQENIRKWINKFRDVLQDTINTSNRDPHYMEDIISSFYNDDIQVFTQEGTKVILPQGSTVIDFAYEQDAETGNHAKFARLNGRLALLTDPLKRGDVVQIFTDPDSVPDDDWEQYAHTYKAKKALRTYRQKAPTQNWCRCPRCTPIPGEEVIGIRDHFNPEQVTVHKRDCREAITLASSYGDDVVSVDYKPDTTLYPVTIAVRAVDRHHLFMDLAACITDTLNLSMESFNTSTERHIVDCRIRLGVHDNAELKTIISHLRSIPGVDEAKRIDN